MRLAIDCAGFSPGRADRLRKALAAKHSVARVARLREELLRGMRARGIDEEAAERIYRMIEAFSDYGFPESHAQSMAHLVYASAWIRRYHPAAFTAALLACQPMGFYSPLSLIGDARRHGITVRGVDVHASRRLACLEPDPGSPTGRPAIRLGLGTVRGLGAEHAERIVAARPFTGLDDLVHRARLPVHVVENLAGAGALGCLGLARRDALWSAGSLAPGRQDPLPGTAGVRVPTGLPPMTPVERTVADLTTTGSSPDSHPVEHLRPRLTRLGALPAAAVRDLPDRAPVLLGGLVTHRQRPPTANGVCFLNVEDETGMINVIVPPPVWERHEQTAVDHPALLIHGTAERAGRTLNVLAHRLGPLPLTDPDALPPTRARPQVPRPDASAGTGGARSAGGIRPFGGIRPGGALRPGGPGCGVRPAGAQRHQHLRVRRRAETHPGVHRVGVRGGQHHAAQAVLREPVADRGGQRRAQPSAARGRGDVDVADPGEGGPVGDHPGVTELGAGGPVVDPELSEPAIASSCFRRERPSAQ